MTRPGARTARRRAPRDRSSGGGPWPHVRRVGLTGTADELVVQLLAAHCAGRRRRPPGARAGRLRRWRPVVEALARRSDHRHRGPLRPITAALPDHSSALRRTHRWLDLCRSSPLAPPVVGLLTPGAAGAGRSGRVGVHRRRRAVVTPRPGGGPARGVGPTRSDPATGRRPVLRGGIPSAGPASRPVPRALRGLDAVSLGSTLLDDLRERFGMTRGWVYGYRSRRSARPAGLRSRRRCRARPDLVPGNGLVPVIERREAQASSGPLSTDPSMNGAIVPIRIQGHGGRSGRRRAPWSAVDHWRARRHADRGRCRRRAARRRAAVRRGSHAGHGRGAATARARDPRRRCAGGRVAGLSRRRHGAPASGGTSRPRVGFAKSSRGSSASCATRSSTCAARSARAPVSPRCWPTTPGYVGETAGIAVHLELAESPTRLRPAVESELLRIAQEAIANARRHSRARNLWVTCLVDAPDVYLRVEDDGRGLLPPREDSFGLAIMQERAMRSRMHARRHRPTGGGTSVEVRPREHRALEPTAVAGARDGRA